MSSQVICWDMNGTILNEEQITETTSLKRENSVRYKTSEISYEDEERPRTISTFWEVTPRKDIGSVLEGLRRIGCVNIVTTNAGDISEIEKILNVLDLRRHFSGVYCVATGRFGKDYSFALQQQGLTENERLGKAIAIGNEYHRDCPINPLGMPLILDSRPFYESSAANLALAIAELSGAGNGNLSLGAKRLFSSKNSSFKLSLEENVDSQSIDFGKRVVPVIII